MESLKILATMCLTRRQAVATLSDVEAICPLHHTPPNLFVWNAHRKSAWCPTCGLPPVPNPFFKK